MHNIKEILQKTLITEDKIVFKVYFENIMREINSSYDGEHSKVINDWIGYYGLCYSIQNDLYDYDGEVFLRGEDIVAKISFNGPFEGELELLEIMTDPGFLSNELDKHITFDVENLYVSFYYSSEAGFQDFAFYYVSEDKHIEFRDLVNDEQMNRLLNFYKTQIYANVPSLDIIQNVKQNWSVNCQENRLQYSIYTDYFEIHNLSFEIEN